VNINPAQYSSFVAVTPSDTALISCRAIYIGLSGNLAVNFASSGGSSVTLLSVPTGGIIPLELNQGRIMATGTTATSMVALV
jgi:hypothetical protein